MTWQSLPSHVRMACHDLPDRCPNTVRVIHRSCHPDGGPLEFAFTLVIPLAQTRARPRCSRQSAFTARCKTCHCPLSVIGHASPLRHRALNDYQVLKYALTCFENLLDSIDTALICLHSKHPRLPTRLKKPSSRLLSERSVSAAGSSANVLPSGHSATPAAEPMPTLANWSA